MNEAQETPFTVEDFKKMFFQAIRDGDEETLNDCFDVFYRLNLPLETLINAGLGDDTELEQSLRSEDEDITIDIADSDENGALHVLAKEGPISLIPVFALRGANFYKKNSVDCGKNSSLHIAAQHGEKARVRSLLENGADIYALNVFGETPLHSASVAGEARVVREIFSFIPDGEERRRYANLEDNNGETALYKALKKGHMITALALIRNGADLKHVSTNANVGTPSSLLKGKRAEIFESYLADEIEFVKLQNQQFRL